jgi:hypothetical protein
VTTFTQPDAGWVRPPLEGPAGALATSVIETVKHAAANAPRSLQAAPGPSGLGTPCTRRLGYMALDWDPKPNRDTDPWASVIGTSVHAWMAATFAAENERLTSEGKAAVDDGFEVLDRYLIEHRIWLPYGISGSCDLYDRLTRTVADWKVTGLPRLREYRLHGPGAQYRAQAHLYALGLQLHGERPEHVAIVFLPRGGRIDGLWTWTESYDPGIAVAALKRYHGIQMFHVTADPEKYPDRWGLLPTADAHCVWCPWFLPGSADLSQGCPGHSAPGNATATTQGA